jgi:hypothetical protein
MRRFRRAYYDVFSRFYDAVIALHSKDGSAARREFLVDRARLRCNGPRPPPDGGRPEGRRGNHAERRQDRTGRAGAKNGPRSGALRTRSPGQSPGWGVRARSRPRPRAVEPLPRRWRPGLAVLVPGDGPARMASRGWRQLARPGRREGRARESTADPPEHPGHDQGTLGSTEVRWGSQVSREDGRTGAPPGRDSLRGQRAGVLTRPALERLPSGQLRPASARTLRGRRA